MNLFVVGFFGGVFFSLSLSLPLSFFARLWDARTTHQTAFRLSTSRSIQRKPDRLTVPYPPSLHVPASYSIRVPTLMNLQATFVLFAGDHKRKPMVPWAPWFHPRYLLCSIYHVLYYSLPYSICTYCLITSSTTTVRLQEWMLASTVLYSTVYAGAPLPPFINFRIKTKSINSIKGIDCPPRLGLFLFLCFIIFRSAHPSHMGGCSPAWANPMTARWGNCHGGGRGVKNATFTLRNGTVKILASHLIYSTHS